MLLLVLILCYCFSIFSMRQCCRYNNYPKYGSTVQNTLIFQCISWLFSQVMHQNCFQNGKPCRLIRHSLVRVYTVCLPVLFPLPVIMVFRKAIMRHLKHIMILLSLHMVSKTYLPAWYQWICLFTPSIAIFGYDHFHIEIQYLIWQTLMYTIVVILWQP